MLCHVSLSLGLCFLSVLAFIHISHNQFTTMIETNTDLDNVQVHAQCWYFGLVSYRLRDKGPKICNEIP